MRPNTFTFVEISLQPVLKYDISVISVPAVIPVESSHRWVWHVNTLAHSRVEGKWCFVQVHRGMRQERSWLWHNRSLNWSFSGLKLVLASFFLLLLVYKNTYVLFILKGQFGGSRAESTDPSPSVLSTARARNSSEQESELHVLLSSLRTPLPSRAHPSESKKMCSAE